MTVVIDQDSYGPVFDIGSEMVKCGFYGDDAPRAVFPSIVGRPKNPGIMVGMNHRDVYVGEEAHAKRGILKSRCPFPLNGESSFSSIRWDDLEKIFYHCPWFELKYTPSYGPCVLASFHYMEERTVEKVAQILLEDHGYLGLMICDPSVCSMYASGRDTGLSVDLGHGFVDICSVNGGMPIQHTKIVVENHIGGKNVTDTLFKVLYLRGYDFSLSREQEIVRDIKEKLCFVYSGLKKKINNFEDHILGDEYNGSFEHEYELPDGSKITIGSERYLAPEIIFNPRLIGSKVPGIHKIIRKSIELCADIDLRKDLYQNIVIVGGTSLLEGIDERIDFEVREMMSEKEKKKYPVKIICPEERKFSIWIGASIIGSLEGACKKHTTLEEYNEHGISIFERKSPACSIMKEKGMNQMRQVVNNLVRLESYSFKNSVDPDLGERKEFVLFDCFTEEEDFNRFRINISGLTVVSIRFKSLLLL